MEFVRIDKQGRIVLPKKMRDEMGTDELALEKQPEQRIVIIPVKSLRQLAGSMPEIDMKKHWREHAKER